MAYRNLQLFLSHPKDFIFSWFSQGQSKVKILPFNPKAREVGNQIVSQLKKACPGMPAYLIGSTGLEICGRGDIDIYATGDPRKFDVLAKSIEPILGKASKNRPTFIEWKTNISGFDVEVVLIDPDTNRFKNQFKLFNIFKNNPLLLKEYEQLKISSNNMPQREYILKRMEFFNRIESIKKP